MKILLVNEGNIERAGVCLFMYHWCRVLYNSFPGNIVVAYFRGGVKDNALKVNFEDIGVRVITGNHSIESTSADRTNRKRIRNDLRDILKLGVDIIHIHSSVIGFTSIVLREARRNKVPIRICHAHGKFDESIIGTIIHDVLRLYIRRTATIYAGCSRSAGVYLFGKNGVTSKKWKWIPNAIDTEKFAFNEKKRQEKRNEIGVQEDEYLLGAVGYLEKVKNHSFLIDVVDGLKKDGVKAKLIILGEGILRERLSEKIKAYDLGKDIFLYGQTEDIPSWLSAMDVFLMPSLSEGLPISAVEAQTSGLICLLSDRISKEVDIIQGVYHLPVDKGQWIWVEAIRILSRDLINRPLSQAKVVEAGFDKRFLTEYIRKLYKIGKER